MTRDIDHSMDLRAPFEDARPLIEHHACDLLGDDVSADQRQARRVETTLTVDLTAGVHHDVVIELGLATTDAETVAVPIRWHAVGHTKLFPTFDGELVLQRHEPHSTLELHGRYQPPLGFVGRVGDRAGAWRAAQKSASALLEHTARRLDHEVDERHDAMPIRPAPYPESLRDREPHRDPGPENYLG